MTICGACGGEIEFRYMNGRPTPIHVNGGGCFGSRTGAGSSRSSPASSFMTAESYINPSACCPVCGQRVFYFQSRQGGRVFFDDVRWPWPKHPCTDNKSAQTRPVGWPAVAPGRGLAFRGKDGERLDIYELETMTRSVTGRDLKFRRIRDRRVFRVHLSNATMKAEMLEEEDFREAPSFVASPPSPGHSTRAISFICARLKRVVALELPKIQPLAP
ncbi:hypothetical protein EV666_103306 [Camelimonas lactis]|uniref:Uncharacterized protein n=1 Tax=Camelimonas lactis TaxID=659006 RepID=A0A4V2RXM7_9HYPH|nr:hypothetical protein EV666_103306 [Camelimonas lactis]